MIGRVGACGAAVYFPESLEGSADGLTRTGETLGDTISSDDSSALGSLTNPTSPYLVRVYAPRRPFLLLAVGIAVAALAVASGADWLWAAILPVFGITITIVLGEFLTGLPMAFASPAAIASDIVESRFISRSEDFPPERRLRLLDAI